EFRVIIPPLADSSPDKSLSGVATAVGETLVGSAKQLPMVRVFSGSTARSLMRLFDAPRPPGTGTGAEAAVLGAVRPAGQDSVEVVFQLRDGIALRVVKTITHRVARGDDDRLPALVTPIITSWIEHREQETRAARASGLDSLLRENTRLREMMRRKPPARPDSSSIPKPPGSDLR
ncbi:MAG TPA: hypothetical protein VFU23_00275, partial [Gemmatimonadales bacterium]|nr:hypothetical protein [Gemmatimonadales bacterium]